LSVLRCQKAQLRARFDTDAVKLACRPDSPPWWKLLGMAAASSLATLFVVRNFFPAEKKVRHPIRANYDVGDEVFVRTMGHLLGPSLVEGNKVTPLENGDQIFPAMLCGIRSAQRTITFENFLFQEGEVSDAFAQALAERAWLLGISIPIFPLVFLLQGCT
jgi:hypothetical protein